MTISLRMNDEDSKLIKKYAEINKISVSELVRQSVLNHIADEYDLRVYEKAMAPYKANPVSYSHEKVKKMLEID